MTTTDYNFTIPAECHSDDHVISIEFDALTYFEQASESELKELILCGYGGDYPSDYVAQFYEETTTKQLFDYLALNHASKEAIGFECHVNKDAAKEWIITNRSNLISVIEFLSEWDAVL